MHEHRNKSSFLSASEIKTKYSGKKCFSSEREGVDYCAIGKPKKIYDKELNANKTVIVKEAKKKECDEK